MTKFELSQRYYHWLLGLIHVEPNDRYSILLRKLHDTEFRYHLPMDENREADGINMRYKFGYLGGYDDTAVSEYLCDTGCSVLEMMIGLCYREETLLNVSTLNDRMNVWFNTMITNLQLDKYDDIHYDDEVVDQILNTFLDRRYDMFGHGNIYCIPEPEEDLRMIDIWTQMCWYVDYYGIK